MYPCSHTHTHTHTKSVCLLPHPIEELFLEYAYSLWIRGDNTVENAKKLEYGGALDARELYPELGKELRSFEGSVVDVLSS